MRARNLLRVGLLRLGNLRLLTPPLRLALGIPVWWSSRGEEGVSDATKAIYGVRPCRSRATNP
eukprot:5187678-Heterocapsa_arctica.AAC.1